MISVNTLIVKSPFLRFCSHAIQDIRTKPVTLHTLRELVITVIHLFASVSTHLDHPKEWQCRSKNHSTRRLLEYHSINKGYHTGLQGGLGHLCPDFLWRDNHSAGLPPPHLLSLVNALRLSEE